MNVLAVDIKEVDHYKVMKTFGKALLSYFDIVTDVLVLLDLIAKQNTRMALIQGISFGVSFLIQSIISIAFGQPLWVVLSGLVGMKPAIESWRDATRAKPFPSQKFDNEVMLMFSRMVEVMFEAIPQSIVQTLAVIQYKDQRTALQFVSLFTSFLTTGFVVASADREMDTSKYKRKNEPLLFGYVPKTDARKQFYASTSFFTLYKTAKVFSLAILIASTSFRYAITLLCLEWFGILAWRKSYENWRWYQHGLDGVGFGLWTHFCIYLCLLAAPFPLIRVPTALTPRIYAGSLMYMLFINFGMVFFSYRVHEGTDFLTEGRAFLGLATLTIICVISGRIAYHYMPDSHRGTFHKAWTFKHHVADYWWNDCVYQADHRQRITTDQEYIRAYIPCWCSRHYVPEEKVIAFYKEHWNIWCEDPPDWFDDPFKAMIPDYVMEVVEK
uniref:XK-related protein n=1 Tax=Triparma pacifica TaxID=91992 RepID=A0A6T5THP8_9STRA|mmetsp:Transcript_562/g.929  ORF Transcript_562/g.929 Transcript_562/m.929 type:complete len:441 (+) Transcript_562:364-1686(+)